MVTRASYILVTNILPTITVQPQNQVVSQGANATFSVTANGTPPLAYQWRFKGTNIAGATANAYTRTNAQPADEGSYSVVVTNSAGSATSSNATLTVIVMAGLIAVSGDPYLQNFDSMGPSGTNTPPGWYVGTGTGAISGTNLTVDSGSSKNTGNYNYGSSGSSDRALGSLAANSTQRDTDARFVNGSGASILSFTISYTGEQWRLGGRGSPTNHLVLQYSTDGINFTALGAAFNFNSPLNSGRAGPLDGNAPANRVSGIGGTYTPATSITNGQVFYLRWADADESSADDGMALDDLTITFMLANNPSATPMADVSVAPTSPVSPTLLRFPYPPRGNASIA